MNRTEFVRLAESVRCWPYRVKVRDEFAHLGQVVVLDVIVKTLDSQTYEPTKIAMSQTIETARLERMEKKQAVQWLYEAIVKLAMHELGEFFSCDGEKPYYPHASFYEIKREALDNWKEKYVAQGRKNEA